MAVTLNKYSNATLLMATGRLDLRDSNIKVALLTADYVPNMHDHTVFADVVAYELGDEYSHTPGGEVIPGLTVTRFEGLITWDGASVVFSTLSGTFKYGVIYLDAVAGSGGDTVTDPLIALIDFDNSSTEASITMPDADYVIFWNAEGIMDLGSCAEVCS